MNTQQGKDGVENVLCCDIVAAAGAGAEWLTCSTVATCRDRRRVSPAVLSSYCCSMCVVLGLDGYNCINRLPRQFSKESSDLSSPIQGFGQRWCLVLCVYALFSLLLQALAIVCGDGQRLFVVDTASGCSATLAGARKDR